MCIQLIKPKKLKLSYNFLNHEFYIQRCLHIAKNGIGTTRPNPSVGAVVVYQNKIIGEGFTSAYGGNHAECKCNKCCTK